MSNSCERTTQYVELVKQTVRQRFDCLIDSGAKLAEIKTVAERFSKAIEAAYDDAILDLIKHLEGGEDEVE